MVSGCSAELSPDLAQGVVVDLSGSGPPLDIILTQTFRHFGFQGQFLHDPFQVVHGHNGGAN